MRLFPVFPEYTEDLSDIFHFFLLVCLLIPTSDNNLDTFMIFPPHDLPLYLSLSPLAISSVFQVSFFSVWSWSHSALETARSCWRNMSKVYIGKWGAAQHLLAEPLVQAGQGVKVTLMRKLRRDFQRSNQVSDLLMKSSQLPSSLWHCLDLAALLLCGGHLCHNQGNPSHSCVNDFRRPIRLTWTLSVSSWCCCPLMAFSRSVNLH